MRYEKPDFEIRIKGHRLLTVEGDQIKIDGRDFHADLHDLASLTKILSDVLDYAGEAKKPRLVEPGGAGANVISPHTVPRGRSRIPQVSA